MKIKQRTKRVGDLPSPLQGIVDGIINASGKELTSKLRKFETWTFEKGDLYSWIDVLNKFDAVLDENVNCDSFLTLSVSNLRPDPPAPCFDKALVCEVLRVSAILLENCSNKHMYNSMEHLVLLLNSDDYDLLLNALRVFNAIVRKASHSSRAAHAHIDATLSSRVFALAQGWGGKEEGLGLLATCQAHPPDRIFENSRGLHLEFYTDLATKDSTVSSALPSTTTTSDPAIPTSASGQPELDSGMGPPSDAMPVERPSPPRPGLTVIDEPNLGSSGESIRENFHRLVLRYGVPESLRFSLLSRIRLALAFPSLELRRQCVRVRLLAFTILVQTHAEGDLITSFFLNEPEIVSELVDLLRAEGEVPLDIRTLAVRTLAALAGDRSRQASVLAATGAGVHHGVLPSLIRKIVASLSACKDSPECPVQIAEALFSLLLTLVSTLSGVSALTTAGVISFLLPLLHDTNPNHVQVVTQCVRVLEAFMDYSNSAATIFRDLGGIDELVQRVHYEIVGSSAKAEGGSDEPMVEGKGKAPMTAIEAVAKPATDRQAVPYTKRIVLKAMLRALAIAVHAQAAQTRLRNLIDGTLPFSLKCILENSRQYGGTLFSIASSLMSDLIHNDPTSLPIFIEKGLPAALLGAISNGILPYSEAICYIPNALASICLNAAGLAAVQAANPIASLLNLFVARDYLRCLQGETPSIIGASLDELMRHVPSLKPLGITACIGLLTKIAEIGSGSVSASTSTAPASTSTALTVPQLTPSSEDITMTDISPALAATTTSTPNPTPASSSSIAPAASASAAAKGKIEKDPSAYVPEYIGNTAKLLESVLANSDHGRAFIEGKGVEALLKLYSLPKLPLGFARSSNSHSLALAFRALSSHHPTPMLRTLLTHIYAQLDEVFSIFTSRIEHSPTKRLDIKTWDEADLTAFLRALGTLECYFGLVSGQMRGPTSLLSEWTSAQGTDACVRLGRLSSVIKWEVADLVAAPIVKPTAPEKPASAPSPSPDRPSSSTTEEPVPMEVSAVASGASASVTVAEGQTAMAMEAQPSSVGAAEPLQAPGQPTSISSTVQTEPPKALKGPREQAHTILSQFLAAVRLLFAGLAKALNSPPRHRRESPATSAAAMRTISTTLSNLVTHNFNFAPEGEVSVSLKASYLARVVDELQEMLFDERHACTNAPLVQALFQCNALQSAFDSFAWLTSTIIEKAQQEKPAESPSASTETAAMEPSGSAESGTDKGVLPSPSGSGGAVLPPARDDDVHYLNRALTSYLSFFERLSSAPLLLASQTQNNYSAAQAQVISQLDLKALARQLQTLVGRALLPLWNNPSVLASRPLRVVACSLNVIKNLVVGAGEEQSDEVTRTQMVQQAAVSNARAQLEAHATDQLVDMGFSRSRARLAVQTVRSALGTGVGLVEQAMEWLLTNPEQEQAQPEPEQNEEDELAAALALSLGQNPASSSTSSTTAPTASTASTDAALAVPQEQPPAPAPALVDAYSLYQPNLLDSLMTLVEKAEVATFAVVDVLVFISKRKSGEERVSVAKAVADAVKNEASKASGGGKNLATALHVMAVLLKEDTAMRGLVSNTDLVSILLRLLKQYYEEESARQSEALGGSAAATALASAPAPDTPTPMTTSPPKDATQKQAAATAETAHTPAWLSPVLLILDALAQLTLPVVTPPAASPAPSLPLPTAATTTAAATTSAGAATPASALAPSSTTTTAMPTATPTPSQPPTPPSFSIPPICHLTSEEQAQAVELCVSILRLKTPPESTVMHALLQLLARLTRSYALAQKVLRMGGLSALISLPASTRFLGHGVLAGVILRHLLEDPTTLQAAMEAEIKSALSRDPSGRHPVPMGTPTPLRTLLTTLAPVASRDPQTFIQAVLATCSLEEIGSRAIVRLSNSPTATLSPPMPGTSTSTGASAASATAGAAPDATPAKETASATKPKPSSVKKPPQSSAQVINGLLDALVLGPSNLPHLDLSFKDEAKGTSAKWKGKGKERDSSARMSLDATFAAATGLSAQSTDRSAGVATTPAASAAALTPPTILQFLAEFVASYPPAVSIILRYSTPPQNWLPYQPFTFVGYVLRELLPYPPTNQSTVSDLLSPHEATRKKAATSQATNFLLLALCARPGEGRRRVIHDIVSALKETAQASSSDVSKFRAVHALADLIYGVLASRSSPTHPASYSVDIARIMIDAGVIPALTDALKALDLNYPTAPQLANAVLKPLELLTRVVANPATRSHEASSTSKPPQALPSSSATPNITTTTTLPTTISTPATTTAAAAVTAPPTSTAGASTISPSSATSASSGPQDRQPEGTAAGAASSSSLDRSTSGGPDLQRLGSQVDSRVVDHDMRMVDEDAPIHLPPAAGEEMQVDSITFSHSGHEHDEDEDEEDDDDSDSEGEREHDDDDDDEDDDDGDDDDDDDGDEHEGHEHDEEEGHEEDQEEDDEEDHHGEVEREEEEDAEEAEDEDSEAIDGIVDHIVQQPEGARRRRARRRLVAGGAGGMDLDGEQGEEDAGGDVVLDFGQLNRPQSFINMQVEGEEAEEGEDEEEEGDEEADVADEGFDAGDDQAPDIQDEAEQMLAFANGDANAALNPDGTPIGMEVRLPRIPREIVDDIMQLNNLGRQSWRYLGNTTTGQLGAAPVFINEFFGVPARRARHGGGGTHTFARGQRSGGGVRLPFPQITSAPRPERRGIEHPLLQRMEQGAGGPSAGTVTAGIALQAILGDDAPPHFISGELPPGISLDMFNGSRSIEGLALQAGMVPQAQVTYITSGPGASSSTARFTSHIADIITNATAQTAYNAGRQVVPARWTDDGQRPTTSTTAFATSLESALLEALRTVAREKAKSHPTPPLSAPASTLPTGMSQLGLSTPPTTTPTPLTAVPPVEPPIEPIDTMPESAPPAPAPAAVPDITLPDVAVPMEVSPQVNEHLPSAPAPPPPPSPIPPESPPSPLVESPPPPVATPMEQLPVPVPEPTAAPEASPLETTTPAPAPAPAPPPPPPSSDDSASTDPAASRPPEASSAAAAAAGSFLGGIDPTFLAALPDDLRAEVLASHIQQIAAMSGSAAPGSAEGEGITATTSTLNSEFLAALPTEIQQEVLEQERALRRMQQRQRQAAAAAAAGPSGSTMAMARAQDMDNATFIETLPPDIREEVLLTQDEAFLSTLTPEMIAEAHLLRERAIHHYNQIPSRQFRITPTGALLPTNPSAGETAAAGALRAAAAANQPADREGTPLIDDAGLIALVRLLYLAQPLR